MPQISVFEQDATPVSRTAGDLWITSDGVVRMATQVANNVWTQLVKAPPASSRPTIQVLTDTCTRASFTDGLSTVGTRVMAGYLPVGALVLGTVLSAVTGFIGDTSATLTVGDGSDVDRYMTGTPSVFTTAAYVECGIPSGIKLVVTANSPTLTLTSNADFTNVTAGSVTVSIYYVMTA